jgi:DNA-binding transcriptional LysR family regulator
MAASPDDVMAMMYFARVVEQRSFTAAAAKLGVSKSVVSARIAAFERRLRTPLLHRTTRKLSLTREGMALYERCARVAAAADEAAAAADRAGDAPHGLLRVDAPTVFAQEQLAAPVAAFLAAHPQVRIALTMRDRMIDLVEEGIDVAVRITMKLAGAGLVARKLGADRTVLCASPAYLTRKGTPRSPEDLVHHDCLLYTLLKSSDEWRFRDGKRTFSVDIEARFAAASGAVLRSAALAGMGLTVLPRFMIAADLAAGRLRPVIDSFEGVALGIYAVYPQPQPRGGRPPAKVRAFVDLLAAHFRTHSIA